MRPLQDIALIHQVPEYFLPLLKEDIELTVGLV